MNILIIDENCNAVDLARHLAQRRNIDDQVFLATDSVDHAVWAADGLRILPGFDRVEQLKICVDDNTIDAVCNFSSYLATAGIFDALSSNGVRCAGTNQAFARTEYEKGYFKKWLADHNVSTPAVIAESLIDCIAQQVDTYSYPLVIKPGFQTGPSTRVCFSPADLTRFVAEVGIALGEGRKSVLYLIEQYIEPAEIISIEYYLVAGTALIEVTSVFRSVGKNRNNALGILHAQAPYPGFAQYEAQCLSMLNLLARDVPHAVRGHMEAIVARDGRLYFMENNARPPACMIWQLHIRDPWALVRGLLDADALVVATAFVSPQEDANRSIVIPLLQTEGSIKVDLETLGNNAGVLFTPFSVQMQHGQAVSCASMMPSLLCATSTSYEESAALLTGVIAKLRNQYNFCWE